MFCLPKELTDKFVAKLKTGEINPEKLTQMTSAERRAFFTEFLGEGNAKQVNTLFESKLLLKNQQAGLIEWAKKAGGLKPEAKRDFLARVQRLDKALDKAELDTFLEDFVSQRLGLGVTEAETSSIISLSKKITEAEERITPDMPDGHPTVMEYGRAMVAFQNYVGDLKIKAKSLTLGEAIKPTNYGKVASNVAGLAKSMKASLDNSVIGRQGLKVLLTNPGIWLKNSKQSFVDIARVFGGKEVLDEVRADVLSRKNARNGLYAKEKLAVGVIEEAFPTSLPGKIPGIKTAFKASETAFTAFQYRTRADLFDKFVEIAEKTGGDTQGLGRLANSLTGRGNLGRIEPIASTVNNIFFSPRLLRSNLDALTGHAFDYNQMGSLARKTAAINTLKIVSGIAAVLTIANALDPESVEKDPRSADFGKIKVGDTRFDISGGMSGLVTLAGRLITFSSKSSTTGKVTQLGTGEYGAADSLGVFYNFFENKLSPAAAVLKDILKQKDFAGNKPTVAGEVSNLLTPLPITNFMELQNNPNSANIIASMLADALGIGINTYSLQENWSNKTSKELLQFKQEFGDQAFTEANKQFNEQYRSWFEEVRHNPEFRNLEPEDQDAITNAKKLEFRKDILGNYGFRYQREPERKRPKF
jgi:hypothetical protein